jgi:WD40 repeat protein
MLVTMNPAISAIKLRGHQGSVTCLDHSSSMTDETSLHASLLSGSDDGTARLWDLREHLRAAICIKVPSQIAGEEVSNEVLSVSFGNYVAQSDSVGPESSGFSRDFTVYISAGPVVYEYDLRQASSPIITLKDSDMITRAQDDVNSISRSCGRQGNPCHIALADDAGHITVLEEGKQQPATTLIHDEQALVMSAVFRPNYHKTLQIASGGTDCRVALWDAAKPRRAVDHVHVQSLSTDVKQVCNPPMINSLAWIPSGKLLAAALGDGSCALFVISNHRSLVMASRLEDAHSGPVASVLFPKWSFSPMQTNSVAARDRLLCSIGNDGNIVLWDLGASLVGDQTPSPSILFPGMSSAINETDDDLLGQPRRIFSWHHDGGKPNWMVSSCGRDTTFPTALFLADTSNEITIYSLSP